MLLYCSVIAVTGTFTVYEERIALCGFDLLISCSVNVSLNQSSTIAWANLYYYTSMMLASETQKYTINATELTIHNITVEDEGEYVCYSEELAIVYAVMDIIVACKHFSFAIFYHYILFQGVQI